MDPLRVQWSHARGKVFANAEATPVQVCSSIIPRPGSSAKSPDQQRFIENLSCAGDSSRLEGCRERHNLVFQWAPV